LIRGHSLDDHACRCASTIADNCSTVLSDFELMQQGNQYPTARAAKRMAKRNGSASGVDIVNTKT